MWGNPGYFFRNVAVKATAKQEGGSRSLAAATVKI
jgi:hypothetical protein